MGTFVERSWKHMAGANLHSNGNGHRAIARDHKDGLARGEAGGENARRRMGRETSVDPQRERKSTWVKGTRRKDPVWKMANLFVLRRGAYRSGS